MDGTATGDKPTVLLISELRTAIRREQRQTATQTARLGRYEEAAASNAHGWSQTRIVETFDLDRKSVRVWLRADQPPSWDQPTKGSVLTSFIDYLSRCWDESCHNAAQLWWEIRALGFTGQRSVVRD